jgi:hypothetical protein
MVNLFRRSRRRFKKLNQVKAILEAGNPVKEENKDKKYTFSNMPQVLALLLINYSFEPKKKKEKEK